MAGKSKPAWIEELGEDYHRFFGNEGEWRNDFHPEEQPNYTSSTVSTVNFFAEDRIEVGDSHTLVICHVRGFPHGKGFMGRVLHNIGLTMAGNCWMVKGTDDEAYLKALEAGKELLKEKEDEMREAMAKYA